MRGLTRAGSAALVVLATMGPASTAQAQPVTQVVTGEHLQLVSVTSSEMSAMGPGETAVWDVGVSVLTPGDAEVDVTLEVLDATPGAFEVTVSRCLQPWTGSGCPGGASDLAAADLVAGARSAIDSTDAQAEPWYRVAVTFVGAELGSTTALRLLAVGAGESVSADGGGPSAPGPLPGTGTTIWPGLMAAGTAVGVGILLADLARRRRQSQESV